MKIRGAEIIVKALEDEGVRFTFGIPGAHNIELYDALARSGRITPVLVTDEQSASFMADAVSRTSQSVGVVNVIPGPGITHCLSGIAEAFMDNIPLVVLSSGIRTDTGKAFQVHDIDQLAILRPVCKAVLKPVVSAEIYPMVRRAFALARSGAPGPVAVEISANLQMLTHDLPACVFDEEPPCAPQPDAPAVEEAVSLLEGARRPAIYAGYGARGAFELLKELAERLAAPVTTTIQGKGVFPETHPLWLWNGFGTSAPPFVRKIMDQCDCLLAIGCRFAEVATASYGMTPPENLIHVDIDGEVFNRNYRARLCVQSDARAFVAGVLESLQARPRDTGLEERIAQGHAKVLEIWRSRHNSEGKVSPSALFEALHEHAGPDAVYVTDSGKGTFLAMEQLRLDGPGRFIGPVDFSCMGYAVPAAIGAKLVDGTRDVIALAGDGALLMTGLELLTAATYRVAPVVCVLRDGELSQIAGYQRASVVRTTCTILPDYSVKAFAAVTGCRYIEITGEGVLDQAIGEAIEAGRHGEPVVVEVPIDYSQVTYYTKGAIANTFWRYPWRERLRLICRFLGRKVTG